MIRERYLIWLVTGLGWVWTLVVAGNGVLLLVTRGIWPPTNGWFAVLSGLAACPLFARPLEKRLGIKRALWLQFVLAATFFILGHIALKVWPHD